MMVRGQRGRHALTGAGWRKWLTQHSLQVRSVLALGVFASFGAVGTLAAWQDTSTVTSGNFAAGTIDLTLKQSSASMLGAVGLNQPYSFSDFSGSNMLPGGAAVFKQLTVSNGGTLDFGYTIAVSGSGALAADTAGLNIGIYATATCTATTSTGQIYSGKAGAAATAARTLSAGASEPLCVRAWLDASAPSSLQNQSASMVFNFAAVQR
ncbi:CalY family protein [Acaricomes phytoseiuli]|uniref:SipW-dependent-type signal peptide-containing protein n=1 Tax=Acaricomes phytoseiuli TaxID=291968 RepID=UPI0012EACE25|nr:SipW-dependent-type signal peptide-containing protein [Acaricomes phytoseiuli]MCW1249267.1 CalY family protein [Acaricomes phytoseiuli]